MDVLPRAFPFASVRPGQSDFLRDAVAAVSEGKHLLAQAPTGLGKTAVALAATIECATNHDKLVLFLTSRQSQHRIVIDTLRLIRSKPLDVRAVDIVSKQSMCLQERHPRNSLSFQEYCNLMTKTRSCRFFSRQNEAAVKQILGDVLHVQETERLCSKYGVCPHKAAIDAASKAHVLVCDYNYVFSDLRETVLPRVNRNVADLVLVIDEAHNLPDRIRSQLSGNLQPHRLVRGAKEARDSDRHLAEFLTLLSKVLVEFLSSVDGAESVDRRFLVDAIDCSAISQSWSYDELAESCERIGKRLSRKGKSTALLDIAAFLEVWKNSSPWVVHMACGGEEPFLGYRLLDPSVLSREVFKQVYSSILMSGTLHPGGMYSDLLGLEKNRVVLRSYRSPFPPENRVTLVTPHLTTLYQKRSDSMIQSIAEEVGRIASATPGNVAAFFPSYNLLSRVANKLKIIAVTKHILVERPEWDKAKRDEAVQRMRELKAEDGALLMGVLGGSFSEGIDYNDNLLSCVIIGGLPVSPPTVETRALDEYYVKKFDKERGHRYAYVIPALNKVLQAAGRCIRSEKDKGAVVILDSRLLTSKYSSCLPPGFDIKPSKDAPYEVRTFFYAASHGQSRASETGRRGGTEADEVAWAGSRGKAQGAQGIPQSSA